MKQGMESVPVENTPPPRVNIMEENPASHKNVERKFSAIPDDTIHNLDSMSSAERSEAFSKAYKEIVGNEELEKLVIKGFLSENNVMPYAQLMNTLTEKCISLSDTEIDSVIRKFKESLRSRATKYATNFNLTGKQLENLQTGMWNDRNPKAALNPEGIKGVARFVRARKMVHALEPKTIPSFYFENYLDAQHKIDLIEVTEREDGAVLNLIQIKSFEYKPGDIEDITRSHKAWVDGFTIDLEAYEKNYSEEPEDSPQMKEFMTNVDKVQDVFLELLTGEDVFSKELLFERLGIGNRPKIQQIWILNEYLPQVLEALDMLKVEGTIGDSEYLTLMPVFDEIRKQLEAVKYQKKDMTGVAEVHSLCTVNEKVVSDKIIFQGQGNKRKSIKIEH
jgi:hypothetical protein